MILFEDIIPEKIDFRVMWNGSSRSFAVGYCFPITPKIASIINNGRRNFISVHVTSPRMLSNTIKISKSKKAISTATKYEPLIDDGRIHGVHHRGILLVVKGNLILQANRDIMTIPDESGRRWIEDLYSISESISNDYQEYLNSNKKYSELRNISKKIDLRTPEIVKAANEFVALHIQMTEQFLQDDHYLNKLLNGLSNYERAHDWEWDEVLVNEFEIIGAILDSYEHDRQGQHLQVSYDELSKVCPNPIIVVNDEGESDEGGKNSSKKIRNYLEKFRLG